MKRTLFLKFSISYLIYGILAFVVLFAYSQHAITTFVIQREAQQLYRESALIASRYGQAYTDEAISREDFERQMQDLSSYLSAKIWVMNNQGEILFDSSWVGNDSSHTTGISIEGFNITDFGNGYYTTGDFYGIFSEEQLTVFSPITTDYRIRSYVLLHKPIKTITKDLVDGFMNIAFFTVAILFLCAFILLLFFLFLVDLPLRKINRVVKAYAKGDFSQKLSIHTNDELGYLGNTLGFMANELDTLEEDQRKFISNVSHDFRSPLTSIKGYVEAMLDGTIPVKMQEKYLQIILFETERLNKLTQSLIDLNRFGQHGMMLDIADFDINQMIKTTILTFEGTCNKKGLVFDLVLTNKELFVTGDMSKIQQVLYNLIDNATKFSNNDSTIKIETNVKNEKVFLSVKDSGIGIPSDCIKKIWDRFYKTDVSRGKDKRGSGLGLSIVKEIIQAHKEHINVISTEGVGTEFIFTLPLAPREVDNE